MTRKFKPFLNIPKYAKTKTKMEAANENRRMSQKLLMMKDKKLEKRPHVK